MQDQRNYKENINNLILIVFSFIPTITLIYASNGSFIKLILIIELILLSIMLIVNYHRFSKVEIFFALLNMFSLIVTLNYHSAFGSAIIFINSLLAFKLFNNISIKRKLFLWLHLINGTCLSIYLFLINRPLYTGNTILDYFNNRINTNLISILFLCAFLHFACYIMLKIDNKKISYLLLFLLGIIYGENIWFYKARSAMLSFILFIVLILLLKKSISYQKSKRICTIALICCLLFPFAYLGLINAIKVVTVFGKGIETRTLVWNACIEMINQYPIFGCGNDLLVEIKSDGTMSASMHNTMLSIWKILGIVPAISFIIFFFQNDSPEENQKRNLYSQIAVISTLPICFFESFYTEQLLYLAFLPFMITKINDDDITDDD